ncbi:MAG TPA: hypothetical protein VGG92_00495 [Caulobacteraceae bacterium]
MVVLAVSVFFGAAWTQAGAGSPRVHSIDGTYELIERVLPNGTVLRPPSVMALYTLSHGRFSLNLFFKNPDGTLASESTIGRYTFSQQRYCEWIAHTIRNNFGRPGVSNTAPVLAQHCAPVTSQNGRYRFAPPGEGLVMSVGAEGFEAKIDGGVKEYWTKVR